MTDAPDGSIRDLGAKVREDLHRLRETAQRQSSELLTRWRDFTHRQPELAVAAAFGVGFVLSGALVSPLTARLARLAGRLYVRRFVGDVVRGLAGEVGELVGGLAATEGTGVA